MKSLAHDRSTQHVLLFELPYVSAAHLQQLLLNNYNLRLLLVSGCSGCDILRGGGDDLHEISETI